MKTKKISKLDNITPHDHMKKRAKLLTNNSTNTDMSIKDTLFFLKTRNVGELSLTKMSLSLIPANVANPNDKQGGKL